MAWFYICWEVKVGLLELFCCARWRSVRTLLHKRIGQRSINVENINVFCSDALTETFNLRTTKQQVLTSENKGQRNAVQNHRSCIAALFISMLSAIFDDWSELYVNIFDVYSDHSFILLPHAAERVSIDSPTVISSHKLIILHDLLARYWINIPFLVGPSLETFDYVTFWWHHFKAFATHLVSATDDTLKFVL